MSAPYGFWEAPGLEEYEAQQHHVPHAGPDGPHQVAARCDTLHQNGVDRHADHDKKYRAMQLSVCADGRARGMFQFYGANRSGRWAGRIIQLQNLPQNHMQSAPWYLSIEINAVFTIIVVVIILAVMCMIRKN